MNAQNAHAHEDRLLDFAYGELPPTEAQLLEQHVQGCARCSKALADIRGVRSTMAQLASEPAPDAGLESLLAYAQQSARRAAAGPEPRPSRWRRWLLPAVGLATVSTFGILTLEVQRGVHLEPALSQKAAPASQKDFKDFAQAPAPTSAAAPASAPLEDNMAPAPELKAQAEAAPGGKGGRPADWMNAGGGGALLERRADSAKEESKAKKSFRARDDEDRRVAAPSPAPMPSKSLAKAEAPKEAELDSFASEDAAASAPRGGASLGTLGGVSSDKVAKRDSLRLGGASSYGRGASSDDAEGAPMAPPPPPPAAAAPMAQAAAPIIASSETAGTGVPARREQAVANRGAPASAEPMPTDELARKDAAPAKPAPAEKSARAMTSRDLALQARDAGNQGDRAREAQLLRAALAAGASGSERLSLLSRLCEAESALGGGEESCARVIAEAPGSAAAQLAQRRLRQAAPSQPAQAPATPPASRQ